MKHEKFHYKQLDELQAKLNELDVALPLSETMDVLPREVTIGSKPSAN